MTLQEILLKLHELSDPEKVAFKRKKFGIVASNALGIYHRDLKDLAKQIGRDNEITIQLFDSGIYEAKLLCSKIFKPADVTEDLMEQWILSFENWEICDSFSMGLFSKSPNAIMKINEWSYRNPEFEKRASYATMASYCMADKHANNELFESFFPLLVREATDDRLYVKKAINWALRSIGKRNIDLNKQAIVVAKKIKQLNSKSALWIANDAIKELEDKKVNILDYPRAIYRTQ